MDAKTFDVIVRDQLQMSTDVLLTKAEEYADDTDRLRNFRLAAALQDVGLSEALGGMLAKHIVSIYEMLGLDASYEPLSKWNEKITDAINYLLLLKAVVVEEHNQKDPI